ncbi:acetylglutamate kinase [Enterococcus sp. MMGLQ5-2]|nr:acetylglutamate kinase [Enterococcus sp. MMGLQ5-2]MBS7585655.1 acetylglutamate kinase [Enterococcus sp. MMGLQ5-1]NPD13514.1 acetylglutamate kinase [Enterococcus sp. MMGLQ5-1]NPD38256.1 acetylglutamate kinase [Enterococcus sp. MMGLQ5-2]
MQKYSGQTIVVKYGGNAMSNEALKISVMKDIALLQMVGVKIVLVHGGGPDISRTLHRLGKETKFIDGLRYTDKEAVEIVATVLSGKVNKSLVADLYELGVKAIGLSGIDGAMIQAEQLDEKFGYVGEITSINPEPILLALENNYIPVIATTGIDHTGQFYNINADIAAADIAAAVNAEQFILLTDVRGVLRDVDNPESLISEINIKEIPNLIDSGIISGGMIPKIDSCINAMNKGLKEAVIIDGRVEHSILLELFADEGFGTLISQ